MQEKEKLNLELPSTDPIELNECLPQFIGPVEKMLKRYQQCPICGGHLHFSHTTDFNHNITHELAKCPECQIRIRKVVHRLQ